MANIAISGSATPGTREVNVITVGETPDPLAGGFSVTQATVLAPTISSITPTSGPAGTTVTINGTNFRSTLGSSYVSFNGVKATS